MSVFDTTEITHIDALRQALIQNGINPTTIDRMYIVSDPEGLAAQNFVWAAWDPSKWRENGIQTMPRDFKFKYVAGKYVTYIRGCDADILPSVADQPHILTDDEELGEGEIRVIGNMIIDGPNLKRIKTIIHPNPDFDNQTTFPKVVLSVSNTNLDFQELINIPFGSEYNLINRPSRMTVYAPNHLYEMMVLRFHSFSSQMRDMVMATDNFPINTDIIYRWRIDETVLVNGRGINMTGRVCVSKTKNGAAVYLV